MKKVILSLLSLTLVLGVTNSAFAQGVTTQNENGKAIKVSG